MATGSVPREGDRYRWTGDSGPCSGPSPRWPWPWRSGGAPTAHGQDQLPAFPSDPAPAPAPVEAMPAPDAPGNPLALRDNTPVAKPARPEPAHRPQANAPRATRRSGGPPTRPTTATHSARPRSSPAPAPVKSERPGEGYGLTDRVPTGPQAIGLTVEVVAPEVMNVGQVKTVKLIVRNTGAADAAAVHVHYSLPKELELVSAQPEAKAAPDEPARLSWGPYLIAAGSDQIIALKVKPRGVGTIDHTSSVTLHDRRPDALDDPGADAPRRAGRHAGQGAQGPDGGVPDHRVQPRQRPGAERHGPGQAQLGPEGQRRRDRRADDRRPPARPARRARPARGRHDRRGRADLHRDGL